jgi:hypothetical protein
VKTVAFLATLSLAAAVPADELRYERTLPNEVAGGRVAFEPDGLMLAHTRDGFADLRILDADGSQVPWRRVPRGQLGRAPATVLNSGRRGDAAVALIDVGTSRRFYERVELEIAGGNFVGRATVLGADRRLGPYTRLSTTTVFDVRGAEAARSTTVVFPPTDFRFLELRATGVARITGATVLGQYERSDLVRRRSGVVAGRRDARDTVLTLDFGVRGVPVTELDVSASDERYDRVVRVEAANRRETWAPVGTGRIRRAPGELSPRIELVSEWRYLRVTIENGDDPPLSDVRVEAYGPSFALMVEPGHPTPLRLLYGSPDVPRPSYEFARLPAEPPTEVLAPAQLPPERLNSAFELPGESFGVRHRWLVQAALGLAAVVVALAGFLALRRRA